MSRYRWDTEAGALVEVTGESRSSAAVNGPVTDLYMDGQRAADGTDIGSRKKRRAYMQAHQLADFSDFTQTFERAAKHREAVADGSADTGERREAVRRALEQPHPPRRRG